MNIGDALRIKYPEADPIFNIQTIVDDGEIKLAVWNMGSIPRPTEEELEELMNDPAIIAEYKKQQFNGINRKLLEELDAIDLKSIRALRTGDTQRLAELETEAAKIRTQLQQVN